MKKIILTTSLLIFCSAAAFTQMNVFGVHWEINAPTRWRLPHRNQLVGRKG